MSSDGTPLLRLQGLRKVFPGVVAIGSASLELLRGEIHALVGENGAGKSTLIKVLTGVHRPDAGEIFLEGKSVAFDTPLEAQSAGLATIYQEFTLIPALTVRENLFLGRERSKHGFIDASLEYQQAASLLQKLGLDVDPDAIVSDLRVAQQQLVEIARALASDAALLIMDEPTAALTPREVEKLFSILRELAERGIGIIFISHRLDEVLEIADRITVMRDGETIATRKTGDVTRQQLIELMVGRSLDQEFPKIPAVRGDVCLEVRQLSGGFVENICFKVHRGEILGLAGLMGSGRTETARMIFGADPRSSGEILLDGSPIDLRSPLDAIRHGICLLTEDRKSQGLVLKASVRDNFALPNLSNWSNFGWINQSEETTRFLHHIESLKIRLADPEQPADSLSGGNQQKLLLARWLESHSRVLIFDEPTRGIDVGAKYELYLLLNALAAQGKAVIMISSELPEILGMSDRILVMRAGKISGEITDVAEASQERVMALAV
ncbi:MAG: sugar ABC transporter ATP-binding protein [bacterium]|nr:sugar ABC transporter ATP-binding protein [bacterium]